MKEREHSNGIEELINGALKRNLPSTLPLQKMPEAKIIENNREVLVLIKLFGFDPAQVTLQQEGTFLRLEGKQEERSLFNAQIPLPWYADLPQISAEEQQGDLYVHIPKKKEYQQRRGLF